MKKILIFSILFLFVCNERLPEPPIPKSLSVKGKTFQGDPRTAKPEPGCEGCAEPGYAKFEADGILEFAYPGSDLIDGGTYTQNQREVKIHLGGEDKALIFILSKDGIVLKNDAQSIIFRDEKYPWK